MKEHEKCKKRATTDFNALDGSRDIPLQRFSASFSLKYDITDAILQDNEK